MKPLPPGWEVDPNPPSMEGGRATRIVRVGRKARPKHRGIYLFVTAVAAGGCVLLIADSAQTMLAEDFRNAVQCPDASSPGCYQLYPGVISSVRVTRTSEGQRDEVVIASQNTSTHVSLLPTPSAAPLVQAGAAVKVEWYVGSVATVWIGSQSIPSVTNPGTRADFAYVGWMLIWIAGLFAGLVLITARLRRYAASPVVSGIAGVVLGLAGSQIVLPTGTVGWSSRPRFREVYVLPLMFAVVAVIAIRPFMNPDRRLIASIIDLTVFGATLVALILTVRNSRVMADQTTLYKTDWLGRIRSWPLTEVLEAIPYQVRGQYSVVPAIAFVGDNGATLLSVSGLTWNVEEIEALAVNLRIPMTVGGVPRTKPRSRWVVLGALALTLLSVVVLAWSFNGGSG